MTSSGREKTEVYLLTGFLGAGKTTLLKRILSLGADLSGTVVIVNEFGDVGIDGLLLKEANSNVVELASGCVCCTLKMDLKVTLERIRAEFDPQRIFIEATGVADPAAIIEVFQDKAFQPTMKVQKVITVLEPDFWESRENFGLFFLSQLKEADLILLNKIDDVEPDKIPQLLNEIHETIPGCRVVPTIHCNVDTGSIWPQDLRLDLEHIQDLFYNTTGSSEDKAKAHHRHYHDHGSDEDHSHPSDAEKLGFEAFSFQSSEPFNEDCFRHFIESLPWELFRIKGVVRFHDRTVMLNYVGGRGEWTEWDGPEETRLAFVGLKVNHRGTIEKLKKCIYGP